MGNKVSLEENLIDLRIVSKQMARSAKKCEANEKAALNKLKKVSGIDCHLFLVLFRKNRQVNYDLTALLARVYFAESCPNLFLILLLFLFFCANRPSSRATRKAHAFMDKTPFAKRIKP